MDIIVTLDVTSRSMMSGYRAAGKPRRSGARPLGAVLAAACLLLAACGKAPDAGASRGSAGGTSAAEAAAGGAASGTKTNRKTPQVDQGSEGVTLTPEESKKLGVRIEPAQAAEYRSESVGYGVVLDHQTIAQAVADLEIAQAGARLSKATLERTRQLRGTPGALSADVEQTAAQKAAVDSAALTLTTEKLSSTWGMQPPWKSNFRDARLQSLAHGDTQLVRVTFPLGSVPGIPDELQGGPVGSTRIEATSRMHPVWVAPADVSIPGRSFFAMLPAGALAEGERLQVWAPTGKPAPGALIPTAALVLNSGKFWCYVEKEPGKLTRVEVDTNRPASGGYVVMQSIKPGDKIAITAASQLLAMETGSSEEPD